MQIQHQLIELFDCHALVPMLLLLQDSLVHGVRLPKSVQSINPAHLFLLEDLLRLSHDQEVPLWILLKVVQGGKVLIETIRVDLLQKMGFP